MFLDGSSLPDPETKLHRREYWKPSAAPGLEVELAIERRDGRFVKIEFREEYGTEAGRLAGSLRLFEAGVTNRLLAEFLVGQEASPSTGGIEIRTSSGLGGMRVSSTVIELAEEKSLRPEIVLEGRVDHGPDFRP